MPKGTEGIDYVVSNGGGTRLGLDSNFVSGLQDFGNWVGDTFFGGSHSTNEANKLMNFQNIAFQKQENDITRQREDNAVQRAAQDMTAAGLSKTLAAGSPASAQSMTAPSNSFAMEKNLAGMNAFKMMQDLHFKRREDQRAKDLNDAQIAKLNSETRAQNLSNDTFMEDFRNKQALNIANTNVSNALVGVHNSQAEINSITGKNLQHQIDTDIAYKSQLKLESASHLILNTKQVEKMAEEITGEILKNEELRKLNAEHDQKLKLLIQDETKAVLEIASLQQNLNYAKQHGYPVGAFPNGFWGGAQAFGEYLGNNGVGNVLHRILFEPLIGKDSKAYEFLFKSPFLSKYNELAGKSADWMENLGGNILDGLRNIMNFSPLNWILN